MIFSLDVRRARKGDCLLLHYGTKGDPGLMLIDGGPARVYRPHLKPRLDAIRQARGLAAAASLPVDVAMVSHIDDDHIKGLLELTGELVEARNASRPLPVKLRSFWHNSFDDIIGNDPEELREAVSAVFGPASLAGTPEVAGIDDHTAMVLASVGQGFRLRDDIRRLRIRLNPKHGGGLVMAAKRSGAIDMGRGLSFLVAGPMKPELVRLQKEHAKFLKAAAKKRKTRAALAAFSDASVANLSSLVVLAEAGGKRMLLTGDARGDKLVEGLELTGALEPDEDMHVDIFKIPHHGSDRNMEKSVFQRITADHYVFSGDGEHGNPERDTLDKLRRARPASASYTIHLTYPVVEIDEAREHDWKQQQRREKARKKKKARTRVRPNWSTARHGLEGFFDKHPAMAARLKVNDGKRHVIELLERIGV